MIIEVDLTSGVPSVELTDAEDCKRFHLGVRGTDRDALAAVLAGQGLGSALPSGDVMISMAAVKRLALGRVGPGWNERFDGMVAYAETKGWVDTASGSLQGHVEWRS